MIKKAVQIGNPIVRNKSLEIKDYKKAAKIAGDLIDSMRACNLVGMAAPQIGLNLRIFVSEIRKTPTRSEKSSDQVRVFINPKIVAKSKKQTILYEGCGSVANSALFGPVRRPQKVTVSAYDINGKKFLLKADGLLAKIIQHEIDHLNGILCIDKFIDTKKIMEREEYIKR